MKLLIFSMVLLTTYFLSACKYEEDYSFVSDARASFYSEEVFVNGLLCKDISNKVGACSLQLPDSNNSLSLEIAERPYEYRLNVVCSSKTNFPDYSTQVFEMQKHQLTITFPQNDIVSFTCVGSIFPLDRAEAVSTQFEIRIKLYSASHIPLDQPRVEGNRLVVGQYALHTRVCTSLGCKWHSEKPLIKFKGTNPKVRSESASGRVSYYGI